jgi:hypothetical protein
VRETVPPTNAATSRRWSPRRFALVELALWIVLGVAVAAALKYRAGADGRRAERQHAVELRTMQVVDSLNDARKSVLMKLGLWLPPDSANTDPDSLFSPPVPKPPPDYHAMLLAGLQPGEDTSVVRTQLAELEASSRSYDTALRDRLSRSTAEHDAIKQRAVTERRMATIAGATAAVVLIVASAWLALAWRGQRNESA